METLTTPLIKTKQNQQLLHHKERGLTSMNLAKTTPLIVPAQNGFFQALVGFQAIMEDPQIA